MELAAALELAEPAIFVARVRWTEQAFLAREIPDYALPASLDVLRRILGQRLPDGAREPALACLDQALESLGKAADGDFGGGLDPAEPRQRLALEYLSAALAGDVRGARELVLKAVEQGLPAREACLAVLLPAQVEIGRMWHAGEIRIAEERVLTGVSVRLLTLLSERLERQPQRDLTVVAAAVVGNTHDIAVRVLTDLFEAAGWRALCLGADVPPEELRAAVDYFNADLVVLSAALVTQLKGLAASIEAVQSGRDQPPRIIVGGQAFAETPELWRRLGADGYVADIGNTVELAERIMAR
jgi:methanogenic corrinoid protein MtbC1